MKMMRTAIVGTGFMGRVHLEAVRRLEFCRSCRCRRQKRRAARPLGCGFFHPNDCP